MPIGLQNEDLYLTCRRIAKAGGVIFYDRTPLGAANATAAGTGTSRASITTTYPVPDLAVELLAMAPGYAPTAAAAADSIIAFNDIQGTSFKFQPQQVLGPIGGVNLSVGAEYLTPQEWFTVRSPVNASNQYDFGVTPLKANAHNFKAWNDLMYSTIASGDPVIFSQVSAVSAFNSAGSNAAGTLQLNNANQLYEIMTGQSPETAAVAQENQILSTNVNCVSLAPVQSFNYGQDTPAVITTTSGTTNPPQISRYMPLGEYFTIPSPTLTFTCTLDVATSNNMTVAHCVRYTSFG